MSMTTLTDALGIDEKRGFELYQEALKTVANRKVAKTLVSIQMDFSSAEAIAIAYFLGSIWANLVNGNPLMAYALLEMKNDKEEQKGDE